MKKNKGLIFLILVLLFVKGNGYSQGYSNNNKKNTNQFRWPEGKKMGLSLTFDDARLSEIDKGIPLLDKYGVKATFYVSPENMVQRIEGWKSAVKNGHEIGNHSLVHPCSGNFWWSREKALEDYTLSKMKKELDSANTFIKNKLNIQPVSFAYPCGQTYIGEGINTKSYVPLVAEMFESGRGWLNEAPNAPLFCNMFQLTAMRLDEKSFEEIHTLIEEAKSNGQWLILAGHEMDEKNDYHTSLLTTIEKICQYATNPENGIWIDNVHNIASYVIEKRGEKSFSEKPTGK